MHQNYNDEHLLFIKEKIKDIKVARFKADINSELPLPNNIIHTLKVADDGTIWFLTSCNGDYAKRIDKSFYAYLDYYKKGTDCKLHVSGCAEIVEDDNEAFLTMSNYSRSVAGRLVLVKMKIMQAEYLESKIMPVGSWKDKVKIAFNHLFLSTPHRIYDFS